mmetsp:Transcript_39342/g.77891  ORF Transcript_39342/g.77891 Transcript_39342/m.77891 type:complete len:200 (+) Transcript_39342:68-667(+)
MPPPTKPAVPPTAEPTQRPVPPPRAAPTGIESPKVNTAGTSPNAAPTKLPETKPVAPPPAPRVTAPPTAEAAVTCALGSAATFCTPSPSSETFARLMAAVSTAFTATGSTSDRAAPNAVPAAFAENIFSNVEYVALAWDLLEVAFMCRTASRMSSADASAGTKEDSGFGETWLFAAVLRRLSPWSLPPASSPSPALLLP